MIHARLYALAREWETSTRDSRDFYPYFALISELHFQADLRFGDYIQYLEQDGPFLTRLEKWLNNVPQVPHQQALLQLIPHLVFLDHSELISVYRDAFRRVISSWIHDAVLSIDELVSSDFVEKQRQALVEYQIASVTESFNHNTLLQTNALHGLPRPIMLGHNPEEVAAAINKLPQGLKGCIICEDIVGSGTQAGRILRAVEAAAPSNWRLLFVPLIAFQAGIDKILGTYVSRTAVKPVVTLPSTHCLKEEPQPEEPSVFKVVRGIIKNNASKILQLYDEADDEPKDPFGFDGAGGLIVTCHNAPNNTLPLVHHKAPDWHPLFRRLHHKDRPR